MAIEPKFKKRIVTILNMDGTPWKPTKKKKSGGKK